MTSTNPFRGTQRIIFKSLNDHIHLIFVAFRYRFARFLDVDQFQDRSILPLGPEKLKEYVKLLTSKGRSTITDL